MVPFQSIEHCKNLCISCCNSLCRGLWLVTFTQHVFVEVRKINVHAYTITVLLWSHNDRSTPFSGFCNNSTCHYCQKVGHYARACHSKQANRQSGYYQANSLPRLPRPRLATALISCQLVYQLLNRCPQLIQLLLYLLNSFTEWLLPHRCIARFGGRYFGCRWTALTPS